MYRNTYEMRQAEGFELLTQEQRKKFYELVYEINEALRDRDERGRTIFERDYIKMKVYQDHRAGQVGYSENDIEIDVTLFDGEQMNFQSSVFF